MERLTVVGVDASPSSRLALARACTLGDRLLVLVRTGAQVPAGLPATSRVRRVPRIAPDVVFDVAAETGASFTVISDAMANPVVALRPAMLAARRGIRAHGGSHVCMLVSRDAEPPAEAAPTGCYRRILVGVDASPGAAVAALVAGRIAADCDARLDIAAIERRRDSALRDLVERLASPGSTQPPSAFRSCGPVQAPHLQTALDALSAAPVDAHVEFRVGEPADVLVRASRNDDHDLLVSSTIGVNGHGRQGHVAQVTRRLLRLSRVDHLVVFDAFTLGLRTADSSGDLVADAAAALAGGTDPALGEAAATLHDEDGHRP
ncbi:MAG: universal stress protein [Acidimicrobiia bacterium]